MISLWCLKRKTGDGNYITNYVVMVKVITKERTGPLSSIGEYNWCIVKGLNLSLGLHFNQVNFKDIEALITSGYQR